MTENLILKCPFCEKETVSALFIPSFFQAHTSRTSHQSKTTFYKTKEKYEVQSGCSECGKSTKEIQKALEQGVRNPEKDKKILERLKGSGIDMKFETKF